MQTTVTSPTGPTADFVKDIQSRIKVLEEGILLVEELRETTVESVNAMWSRVEEITARWPQFGYVVDLRHVKRPSSAVRAELRRRLRRIRPKLLFVAIVVGDNVLIKATARVVAYSLSISPFAICETVAGAIEEVQRAVRRKSAR
jgi:hypothetical protein